MITLDEAIKNAEEEAKEQDKLCKRYDDASGYSRSHNEDIRTTNAKRCEKCAEDHRQLAEWLKDYKRLLEQEPCDDVVSRQAVLKIIDGWYEQNRDTENIEDLIVLITYMDSVIPQEQAGHWIETEYHRWKCSVCREKGMSEWDNIHDVRTNFCPYCGCRMVEPQESEKV